MNRTALDLLVRTVVAEIGAERCTGCGAPLADSELGVHEGEDGRVTVKLRCRACDEVLAFGVEPGRADGVARLR